MKGNIKELDVFILKSLKQEEINLKALIKVVFGFKKWILLITLFIFSLGLLYLITAPTEYSTTSKLLMEQPAGLNNKALGGLASISGLGNLGLGDQNSEALPAELIPELLMESDFLKNLMYEKVYLDEVQDSITLLDFVNEYEKHHFYFYLLRLPSFIKSNFFSSEQGPVAIPDKTNISKEQNILSFEPAERKTISQLKKRIVVEKEERLLVIQTKMHESLASAMLNDILVRHLKEYLTDIILEKELKNFNFIKERTEEAKIRVEKTQNSLAKFRDSNRGINSQLVKTEEDRLQSDFNLEFNVYNSLAQQLEQSRIKVQEARPLLTIFQKPQVPVIPSEPKYLLLGIAFLFLGGVIGFLFIFGLLVYRLLKVHFSDV
ncbi:Chain length determinant protein [Cyclobacterium lianum]|uniref:Chain length determinant protein n=1 Tax=Cyclobacterium lianum TaxID=388280 RepID=A0A1M7NDP8_9BACT|nr:Wzz/FepE/Etk N-terminal domain-containing protein [Cyclobacterium lianum]SHN01744.1 Chain length determinant protein [Cyclobacterium lianum]